MSVKVKVINKSKFALPKYETSGASGMDIRANLENDYFVIDKFGTSLIPTGLFVEIPDGYEIQVRPRSGISLKTPLRVANAPGTIDSCYRGEIKVIITNTSDTPFTINDGERIAQLVLCEVPKIEWNETEILSESDRGIGGFGSTGLK